MKYILLLSLFFISSFSLAEETATEPTEAQALYEQGMRHIKRRAYWTTLPAADFRRAIPLIEKSARIGHVEAQVTLGALYASGSFAFAYRALKQEEIYNDRGRAEDVRKANHWLEKAAKQGDARIQYRVGKIMYEELYNLSGTLKERNRALYWLQKSADQGYTLALILLRFIITEG